MGHVQAELAGQGGIAAVVVAALAAGVADLADRGEAVSVLVEVWTAYGAPATGSLSNLSISSAACRSWAAWKCA
jgi:hypothetical protein